MKSARWLFNPCQFGNWLYLCGWGSQEIEAFNPITDTFLSLHAYLPEDSACFLFIESNQLVIMSGKQLTRWEAGQEHELVKFSQLKHPQVCIFCNMSPVVDEGNRRVIVSDEGSFCSFSLDGRKGIVI